MKRTLIVVCVVALCSAALVAQNGMRMVRTQEQSQVRVPAAEPDVTLKVIWSNTGVKTHAYNDTVGWAVTGPASSGGKTQFVALPFKPKAASTAYQLQAAVEYGGSGANQVNLSLYSDNNGAPGTLLGGPVTVTGLANTGTCCAFATANLSSTVSLTAGTQYWIVADTPASGTGSDFVGVWDFIPTAPLNSFNNGSGWVSFTGYEQEPTGRVFGTIP